MNLIQLVDDIKKKKKKKGSPNKEESMPIDCLQTQVGVSSLSWVFDLLALELPPPHLHGLSISLSL